MAVFITFSPITSLAFGIYDNHFKIYEICDEDDVKEKLIVTCNEELKDQTILLSKKQLTLNFDIFLTDFSPEVPFPPPKNM